MLPKQHRLHRGEDFRRVLSRGRKHRSHLGLIAVLPNDVDAIRFGFIVSKATGGAVTRNLIKRRLRAAAAELIHDAPSVDVVVRSAPGSHQITLAQNVSALTDAVAGGR